MATAGVGVLTTAMPFVRWGVDGSAARAVAAMPPKRGGTLRVALPLDVANFDPFYLVYDNFFMQRTLYDSLVQYDEHMHPVPQAAESWELAKDGRSIRIRLRKGLLFHSGRAMDASDVVFSIRYVQDKSHGSQFTDLFQLIESVETPDPSTVVLRFSRPYPAVFDALNLTFVLDKDAATDLKAKPAGSGPFKLEQWLPGNQIRFVRNTRYWDSPRPYLDAIVQRTIADPNSLAATLQSGDVTMIWGFPLSLYAPLQRDPRLKVAPGLIGTNYYDLALRVTRPPFDNKLFRQAINFAIDREQFVKTVLYGTVPATDLPFPPGSLAYFPDLDRRYTYDLDKARALVKQAGLNDTSFTAISSTQVIPDGAALLQIVQASLRQIGVTMTIQNVEAARWTQLDHAGNFQMLMHSFGRASYDPATLFGAAIMWRPTANATGYSSPEYTRLITDAASTIAPAQRRALYRKIDELMLEECWCIPVAADPTPFAMAKSVEGLSTDRSGVPVLKNVWLSS